MSSETPLEIHALDASVLTPLTPILDVREEWEREIVHLPQSLWIPLGNLLSMSPQEIERLPSPIFTLCHHGVRSLKAANHLRRYKIMAQSIKGGIEAWAQCVDKSLPCY